MTEKLLRLFASIPPESWPRIAEVAEKEIARWRAGEFTTADAVSRLLQAPEARMAEDANLLAMMDQRAAARMPRRPPVTSLTTQRR